MQTASARADRVIAFTISSIPRVLVERQQWVCWRWELRKGKWTKPPINARTGGHADNTDPATWCDFTTACTYALAHDYGIGFVFAEDDPFTGIDLDECRDPQTGSIAAWAVAIIRHTASYSEVSPSQTGVKIIVEATLRNHAGRRRGLLEIYSRRRYFTVTGDRLPDSPATIEPRQSALDTLEASVWRPPVVTEPRARAAHSCTDDALIDRAHRARNGAKFARLWRGDWEGDYPSQSEADAALTAMLAFYTDDPARIDLLFRRSGLCRPKWTDRDDYRQRTIDRVLH